MSMRVSVLNSSNLPLRRSLPPGLCHSHSLGCARLRQAAAVDRFLDSHHQVRANGEMLCFLRIKAEVAEYVAA